MLDINPVAWFSGISPEWAVFFLSMLPITELRVSIPVGIEVFGLSPWMTWLIAVLGNMTPTVGILLLIPHVHAWLMRHHVLGPMIEHKMQRAAGLFSGKYTVYGALALVVFVGIPLPFTGAWTGAFLAFLFDIPFRKSFPLIALGLCLSATIVTVVTVFAGAGLRWLM